MIGLTDARPAAADNFGMRTIARLLLLSQLIALPVVASGEWHEDYLSGRRACDAGEYARCIERMRAAIEQRPESRLKARTTGKNRLDYTPYFYLGVAYYEQGNFENALEALDREAEMGVILRTAKANNFTATRRRARRALAARRGGSPPASAPESPPTGAGGREQALRERIATLEAAQRASQARIAELERRLEQCQKPPASAPQRPDLTTQF